MKGNEKPTLKTSVKGKAIGLLLMAFFTIGWAVTAEISLKGEGHGIVIIAFSLISYVFIGFAIYLLRSSKRIQASEDDEQRISTRQIIKLFYLNFGIEIVAICIICFLLFHFGKTEYIIPVIALTVGLHFYPLAGIFHRKIDYYFATWTCLVAIAGVLLLLFSGYQPSGIHSFVSVGAACATTGYGIFMLNK